MAALSQRRDVLLRVAGTAPRRCDPSVIGWRSDNGWRSVDELHHGAPECPKPPRSTKAECSISRRSTGWGIGPHDAGDRTGRIERRVLELAATTADISAPIRRVDRARQHATSWRRTGPTATPRRWPSKLQAQRIIVAARHGNLRVSPHFYNNEADLDKLRVALS